MPQCFNKPWFSGQRFHSRRKDIASLTVKGSLIGNVNNPVVISALGQVAPSVPLT